MKFFLSRINNQDGSMILVAMMLLLILTIIGITSTSTTVVENRIAVNDQLHKIAFSNADSGLYATPKLIRAVLREGDPLSSSELNDQITYLSDGGSADGKDGNYFYKHLMGYDTYDGGENDIKYELSGNPVKVDVERISAEHVAGGGVEFASGAEGIGAGGGLVNYGLFSVGGSPRESKAKVYARYRYVLGITGGL
ncbi:MAG: hypothetical protein K9K62_00635 [Desulfobacteraceae bacterium]|nr:hypothetical protein [Desulfobacteraceae bacterium]